MILYALVKLFLIPYSWFHQITCCTLNLKVEYPPPYQCCNDAIKRAIELGTWNLLFSCKNVHEQVAIFNLTLMNIFLN